MLSYAKLFMKLNIFNYHSNIIDLLLVVTGIKSSTSKYFLQNVVVVKDFQNFRV